MDPANLLRTGVLVLLAYLAGSIPVGAIVARRVGGPDLRSVGSGRTGGTNALRALGRKWAAVVVIDGRATANCLQLARHRDRPQRASRAHLHGSRHL